MFLLFFVLQLMSPSAHADGDVYAINCGSGASSPFSTDSAAYFNGGDKYTTSAAIDTSGVTAPAPQSVYQSERYGMSFSYTFPFLIPNTRYLVRLHFAEYRYGASGYGGTPARLFSVATNGQTALSNFNVYAAAGAKYKAVAEDVIASADGSGHIEIDFTGGTDNAEIKGIGISGTSVGALQSVSFSGGGSRPITEDNLNEDKSAKVYASPQWQDNSSPANGNADDVNVDHHYRVCYIRNSTIYVSATITLNPVPTSGYYMIRGQEVSGRYSVPATFASLDNGSGALSINTVACSGSLPNTIACLSPLQIAWQYSLDNGQTWSDAGISNNRVYVTLGDAVAGTTLYETVLDTSCRAGQGVTVDDANKNYDNVVAAIWSPFTSKSMRRKHYDGHNVIDNTLMTYWLPEATNCQSLAGMLSGTDGEGSCISWAQFFEAALRVQGIQDAHICEITPNQNVDPNADGFLVKNWNYGLNIRTGADGICNTTAKGDDVQRVPVGEQTSPDVVCVTPGPDGILQTVPQGDDISSDGVNAGDLYPYVLYTGVNIGVSYGSQYGDVADQLGVSGQSNPNPPGSFRNHYVTVYKDHVYDPSYGTGPFDSTNDHENASIDGIQYDDKAKKNDSSVQELTYKLKD